MAVTEFIDESGKYIYCSQITQRYLILPLTVANKATGPTIEPRDSVTYQDKTILSLSVL